MIVVGLTGGVGTGKSTVAGMFKAMGAAVLDADAAAREVAAPGGPALREIVRVFGRGVLQSDGSLDRQKLAARVFASPVKRKKLERIIHPRVVRRMRKELGRLKQAGRAEVVVLDVPLLFEAGVDRLADALVVVSASRAVQYARLRRKYGWSRKEVDARVQAQWKLSAKVALADYVVSNSGGRNATRKQVMDLWRNKLVTPRLRRS